MHPDSPGRRLAFPRQTGQCHSAPERRRKMPSDVLWFSQTPDGRNGIVLDIGAAAPRARFNSFLLVFKVHHLPAVAVPLEQRRH